MQYIWECQNCGKEIAIEHEPVTYLEVEVTCTACGSVQIASGYTDCEECP